MSYYSFKIRKDKFELSVVSEDRYFVITQFDKAYRELLEKKPAETKRSKPQEIKTELPVQTKKEAVKPVKEEKIPTETPAPHSKEKTEEINPVEETIPEKEVLPGDEPATPVSLKEEDAPEDENEETPAFEELEETKNQDKVEEEPVKTEKEPDVPGKEVKEEPKETALETEEAVENLASPPETEEIETKETEIEALKDLSVDKDLEDKEEPALTDEEKEEEAVKTETDDDFQKIIDKKMKEEAAGPAESPTPAQETLEEKSGKEPEKEDSAEENEEEEMLETLKENFEEKPAKNTKVYDILQEKLASIPEEEKNRLNLNRNKSSEKNKPDTALRFKGLDDLIYLKKPQTKLDYLLVTSYFLKENENKESYSLKQINSKIIPKIKEPIDHSVIHESIAHGYFEVVPDESSDITEYTITEEGIDYLLNEL